MLKKIIISELLAKPLWQMTGEEYVALHAYACTMNNGEGAGRQAVVQCRGVHALAEYCTCSDSQIHKLLREGVLDTAIISRIGKTLVFNGEKSLELAQSFVQANRKAKKSKLLM